MELIQTNPQMFNDGQQRRLSDASMQSTVSGLIDNIPLTTITTCEFHVLYLFSHCLCTCLYIHTCAHTPINRSIRRHKNPIDTKPCLSFILNSTTAMVGLETARLRAVLPRRFEQFSSSRTAAPVPCIVLGKFGCNCIHFASAGSFRFVNINRTR